MTKPVQIALSEAGGDQRLRRLLCGKAARLRGVCPLTNLLREWHSLCAWCEALECGSLPPVLKMKSFGAYRALLQRANGGFHTGAEAPPFRLPPENMQAR